MNKIFLFVFSFFCSLNAQWLEQTNPAPSSPNKIQFFNENTEIIEAPDIDNNKNVLYKTYDGGISWTLHNSDFPGSNIYMIDSLIGWAGGQNAIYRTNDGGVTWEAQSVPQQNIYYSTFYFVNENLGFMSGGNDQIFRTTNGGNNWNLEYAGNSDTPIKLYSFCDDQYGFAITESQILKTTDSGDSWQQLPFPLTYPNFISVACLTREKIVAFAQNEILLSFNGGTNWELYYVFQHYQSEMVFVDDSVGFISGSGIFKTTNGGKNWYIQTDPEDWYYTHYENLTFPNENYGWCSEITKLFKTINGGGPRYNYYGIDFPINGDTVYALTEIESTVTPKSTVNIKYSPDDGLNYYNVVDNFDFYTYNTLYWPIPNTPSDKCKLIIESVEYPDHSYETPGNFTIAPPPPLIITNPGRYGMLTGGDFYDITWLSFNVDSIKTELSTNSGSTWEIIVNSYPADSGKFRWRVPFINSQYIFSCRIKISDLDNPQIFDINNGNFGIQLPSLVILYPDGSTILHTGELLSIKIAGDYRGSIKFEFTSDNGNTWSLVDSLNSTEWSFDFPIYYTWSRYYEWIVPDISSDSCRFKLTAYEANQVVNEGYTFRIRNNIPIQTMIDNANEGETIYLTDTEYLECIQINKPITLIGNGTNKTRITGDTLKPL